MDSRKVILSLCLLAAYSIGLSHELIPHCHHDEPSEQAHHAIDHHHHDHNPVNDPFEIEHPQIAHQDHHDQGLLDLLACILSETQHPASSNRMCFCVPVHANLALSWLVKSKIAGDALLPVASRLEDLSGLTPGDNTELGFIVFSSRFLPESSLRGPPSHFHSA